jgi:WD40 repeat protein
MTTALKEFRLRPPRRSFLLPTSVVIVAALAMILHANRNDLLFTVTQSTATSGLAFMDGGSTLAMSDWHGTIEFWDTRKKAKLPLTIKTGGRGLKLSAASNGTIIAAWGARLSDATFFLRLWDIKTGQEIVIHGLLPTEWFAVSPDGKTLVTRPVTRPAHVWDVPARRLVTSVPLSALYEFRFSADGRALFSEAGGIIYRWNTKTWQQEGKYITKAGRNHGGPFAVSSDRRWYAVIGNGLQLEDSQTHRALSALGRRELCFLAGR